MGFQQSYVQFHDAATLLEELEKYKERDTEELGDLAEMIGLATVLQSVGPFEKGELLMIVSGERSEQRNTTRLRMGLGISRVKDIYYIDDLIFDYQIRLNDYFTMNPTD